MKPLENVTIIDLTHMLSGPYGGMLLADLGANTIKVEPPASGEGTRRLLEKSPDYSMDGMGAYFLTLNRNKKSVCIDLKSPEGLELFYRLVEKADVVINNFSPGVPKRLGIDFDTLVKRNPRIITCSITGFGETGPEPDRPAFDLVAQGMGGGMSITGFENGEPLRAGIPIGDLGGGTFACIGILAALNSRNFTGKGQHIDVSMQDCQISLLNYMATMYLMNGVQPKACGNGHFVHVPYNTYKTQTRYIIIAVLTDQFWQALVELFDDNDLRSDEFKHQPGRWANRDFINARVQQHFETNTCEYWLEKLKAARIPSAPVNDFAHALTDSQVLAHNMVVEVELDSGKKVKMPGNPIKLSGADDTFTPPPALGRDTDQVLAELLQMDDAARAALRDRKVIA